MRIEHLAPKHRNGWDRLWAGYLAFYGADVPAEATEATWNRLTGPGEDSGGLVALDADDVPVGLCHRVLRPTTWGVRPACYLEDLFVDPDHRGQGIGRALIDTLAAQGRADGWASIHWITADDNPARNLYRRVARETSWIRYELDLSGS